MRRRIICFKHPTNHIYCTRIAEVSQTEWTVLPTMWRWSVWSIHPTTQPTIYHRCIANNLIGRFYHLCIDGYTVPNHPICCRCIVNNHIDWFYHLYDGQCGEIPTNQLSIFFVDVSLTIYVGGYSAFAATVNVFQSPKHPSQIYHKCIANNLIDWFYHLCDIVMFSVFYITNLI